MKKFMEPELEIKKLLVQDVITASTDIGIPDPDDWETERG